MLFKLIFRNMMRHKLRSILTVCGVAIAVSAFVFLRTVISMWYVSAETSNASRIVTRNNVSITFPLPLAYRERIASAEGVVGVTYFNWFGGIYKNPSEFFAQFAVDPETYFSVYKEFRVSEAEMAAFKNTRAGCIVGKKIAERYGWKLGDVVQLTGTTYEGDWDFTICAIYTGEKANTDETQFFFNWKYLDERISMQDKTRSGNVGFYSALLDNPDKATQVCAAIDGLFVNSSAETITETESAFQLSFIQMSEAIIGSLQAVSMVIIVIMLLVLGNTMSMAARERLRDYATMKSLGFKSGFIYGLIVGEAAFISALGALLGIIIATPLTQGFGAAVSSFFPVFEVSPMLVLGSAIVAVAAGAVAGLVPGRSASETSITDGLRYIG